MSGDRNILSIVLGLALASHAWSPKHAAAPEQDDAVTKALTTHCPDAQSEEVIECARQVMASVDKRIKRDLCSYRPVGCVEAFTAFAKHRNELTIALESAINERSVNAQIEVSLFALQTTLAFEKAGAFKDRRDLERDMSR